LDVAASLDDEGKSSLFILNRDLSKAREVEIVWEDRSPTAVTASWVLTGDDLKASNSFAAPRRVAPQPFAKPAIRNSRSTFEVPAHSYTVVQWTL